MDCRLKYFERSKGFRGLRALVLRVPESKPQPSTALRSAISPLTTPSPARFLIGDRVCLGNFCLEV